MSEPHDGTGAGPHGTVAAPHEGTEGQDGGPPTEAEVLAILAPVARRLADTIARPGAGRGALIEVLRGDQGAVELLAAAFESGREDAAREVILRAPSATSAAPVEPDWSDVESAGERGAIAREESICGACVHAAVCRARPPAEMLIVIRRCIAFRREDE